MLCKGWNSHLPLCAWTSNNAPDSISMFQLLPWVNNKLNVIVFGSKSPCHSNVTKLINCVLTFAFSVFIPLNYQQEYKKNQDECQYTQIE